MIRLSQILYRRPCLGFVLLVVGTPYVVLLPLLAIGVPQDVLKPLKLPFALTPLLFVWLVVGVTEGEPGVARLFGKLWQRGISWKWYLTATFAFTVVAFVALVIRWGYDGFFPPLSEFAPWWQVLLLTPPLLLFPGFTEEFAWRGFLHSRLQRRMHWWWASLFTGCVWASWHGFDFLLGNWTFSWPGFLGYPIYMLSTSIIIGWVYKNAQDSVIVAMLAHFGANIVNFFIPVFEKYEGSVLPAILYLTGIAVLACALPLAEFVASRFAAAN